MTAAECRALLLELAAPVVEYEAMHIHGDVVAWPPSWSTRPATADDVAARLLMLGCRGEANSACGCPVARHLVAHGAAEVSVLPQNGDVIVYELSGHAHDAVLMPSVVSDFALAFDGGAYPALEAR